jgi:hypothetical protein
LRIKETALKSFVKRDPLRSPQGSSAAPVVITAHQRQKLGLPDLWGVAKRFVHYLLARPCKVEITGSRRDHDPPPVHLEPDHVIAPIDVTGLELALQG